MNAEKSRVPAVSKIVKILTLLSAHNQPLSSAEIARFLDLPRSSVHVLLAAMLEEKLLRKVDERRFALGLIVMQWANAYLAGQDIVSAFHENLAAMPQLDNYTLTLSALQGDQVVYLACKNSRAPLEFAFRIGMQLPAVFTATGKFLLSTLSDAALRERITHFPPAETERSVQTFAALEAELAQIRKQGYAVDNGQLRRGMYCYGVGVCDSQGVAQYGIAVSVLEAEVNQTMIKTLTTDLRILAQRLSVLL